MRGYTSPWNKEGNMERTWIQTVTELGWPWLSVFCSVHGERVHEHITELEFYNNLWGLGDRAGKGLIHHPIYPGGPVRQPYAKVGYKIPAQLSLSAFCELYIQSLYCCNVERFASVQYSTVLIQIFLLKETWSNSLGLLSISADHQWQNSRQSLPGSRDRVLLRRTQW